LRRDAAHRVGIRSGHAKLHDVPGGWSEIEAQDATTHRTFLR